jgi:hypothetical protein
MGLCHQTRPRHTRHRDREVRLDLEARRKDLDKVCAVEIVKPKVC